MSCGGLAGEAPRVALVPLRALRAGLVLRACSLRRLDIACPRSNDTCPEQVESCLLRPVVLGLVTVSSTKNSVRIS